MATLRVTRHGAINTESGTPSAITAKKKKTLHIPVIVPKMDNLGIGGQLIISILSSSIEKIVDEGDIDLHPLHGTRQTKMRPFTHNQ